MSNRKHKHTANKAVQRATPIPRNFTYSSRTRTLNLNGQCFFNVGDDWLNRIYG